MFRCPGGGIFKPAPFTHNREGSIGPSLVIKEAGHDKFWGDNTHAYSRS